MDRILPSKLDKYLLIEKIGEGAMSEVYKAQAHHLWDRIVAIKLLRKEFQYDQEFIDLIKSEALTLGNLRHPNLIWVYSFFIGNEIYITMEFVDGLNLKNILDKMALAKKVFSIAAACFIVKEVAKALAYLHTEQEKTDKNKILHTDLGIHNILISKQGEIKLIDFSLAQARLNLKHSGSELSWCTLQGLSPERARGEVFDEQSDIFHLGVILYKLLLGNSPFGNKDSYDLHETIKQFNVSSLYFPENFDKTLKSILIKSLEEPHLRYTHAKQAEKALMQYLNVSYPDYGPIEFEEELRKKLVLA